MMVVIMIYRDRPTGFASVLAPERVRDDRNRHAEEWHR